MNPQLFQSFEFKKPIEIEDMKDGDEIVAHPNKIIIRMDKEAEEKDLSEILSKAKMGENDPLLATFYFQENITKEDYRYGKAFHELCLPLMDAWAYKTMRKWAPNIYQKEIEEISLMIGGMFPIKFRDTGDVDLRRMYLGYWASLYENPENKINIVLETNEENKEAWEGYIASLKEFIRKEPDVAMFLALPVVSKAPYKVDLLVDGEGHRYFDVRGNATVASQI